MTVSLRGTTLACGFAGAFLLTLAGCGGEVNESAEPETPPAAEGPTFGRDESPVIQPVPASGGVVNLIESIGKVLTESKTRESFADENGIILPASEEQLADGAVEVGWPGQRSVALFDLGAGSKIDLASFTPVDGSEAEVTLEDGVLRIKGGPGFVRSEEQYDDFILQAEVKLNSPDSNSGLFFRTMEPTAEAPSNGYEMQLQNTLGPGGRTDPDDYGDGFGTGGIFRRQAARYVNADDGEWFHVTLVVVGNRMATWVNGLQVTAFTDERDPDPNPRKGRRDEAGYIVLQGHDPTTDVSFRNVRIQSLDDDAGE